jgi:hypothetical protein
MAFSRTGGSGKAAQILEKENRREFRETERERESRMGGGESTLIHVTALKC